MKTFILQLLLLILPWGLGALDFFGFRGMDFYGSTNMNLSSQDFQSTKIKGDLGFRLKLSGLTGIFSVGIPSTSIADFPSTFSGMDSFEGATDFFNIRYGVSTNLSFKKLPYNMKIFVGGLGFGNSLSRLKSPGLYVSSALKSPVLPVAGLNPMVPSFDSSEKPLSFAVNFVPSKKMVPEIHLALTKNLEFYASVFKTWVFPSTLSLTLALNGGTFVYGNDYDDSWFQVDRPFLKDHYFSADFEMFLTFQWFKTFLSSALVQSPFGGFYKWIRWQSDLTLQNFVLNTAFYACDSDLISPSGTKVGTSLQFQINPWWKFIFHNMRFNTGIFFQESMKHSDAKSMVFHDLNFRWDGLLKMQNRNHSANASFKFSTLDKSWDLGVGTSVSFKGKKINSSVACNYKFDGGKSTVGVSTGFYPRESVLESLSSSVNLSLKENQITSTQVQLSASLRKRVKKLSFTGKIGFSTNFSNKP